MEKSCPVQIVDFIFQKSKKLSLLLHAIQQAVTSFSQLILFQPSHWFSSNINGTFSYAFQPSGHLL